MKWETVIQLEMDLYEQSGFKQNCVSLWSTNLLVFKQFNLILLCLLTVAFGLQDMLQTIIYFLTAKPSVQEILLLKVLQVSILLNTLLVTVFGSGCELNKQSHLQTITDEAEPGSNGQWLDLTRHLFKSLLLTSHGLGCSQLFALKTRNPSTNPEHSCYPSMQTKQEKRSLNNTTFEKSYQQNSLHQGALHSSTYLSSLSVKELLECMTRILNISHCPDSQQAYQITE